MAERSVNWPSDLGALLRLHANASAWFWLDGESPLDPTGKSYLGVATRVHSAVPGRETEFLQVIRDLRGADLVVALSYEFGVALLGEQPSPDTAAPAVALETDAVLVLDHGSGTAHVRGVTEEAIERWIAQYQAVLVGGVGDRDGHWDGGDGADSANGVGGGDGIDDRVSDGKSSLASAPATDARQSPRSDLQWRSSDADYLAQIDACQSAIYDGEAYVVCLTDTCETTLPWQDPLDLYLRVRESGTELRGGVITVPGRALISASPEQFLSLRDRMLATHPMKGTRKRSSDPVCDAASARELAADEKERAENLMIVDLMRNDLSRVCEPGSVRTERFLRVETHRQVHQLVSTVTGTLRADQDLCDALAACLPGGSMTGAPKQRAVQLLSELEAGSRGLYSGCFGWINAEQTHAELAMTIRSIELRWRGDRGASVHARIGAGGGITAESVAAQELAEKALKAQALIDALLGDRPQTSGS